MEIWKRTITKFKQLASFILALMLVCFEIRIDYGVYVLYHFINLLSVIRQV